MGLDRRVTGHWLHSRASVQVTGASMAVLNLQRAILKAKTATERRVGPGGRGKDWKRWPGVDRSCSSRWQPWPLWEV